MPNVICISGGGQRLEPLQNGRFRAKIAIPKKGAENDPRSSLELCEKHHSKKHLIFEKRCSFKMAKIGHDHKARAFAKWSV